MHSITNVPLKSTHKIRNTKKSQKMSNHRAKIELTPKRSTPFALECLHRILLIYIYKNKNSLFYLRDKYSRKINNLNVS